MKPTLSFIGAGKVGSSLARLWYETGYDIHMVYSQSKKHAEYLAQTINAVVADNPVMTVNADIVFLTVPDDSIVAVADSLRRANWHGKAVVHTSGAASIDKLQSLADAGAMVGSLHPAFPFAGEMTSMQEIEATTFAIEANSEQLHNWLQQLVESLHGYPIIIPEGAKARYHAALVIGSNFTVTLYSIAHQLLRSLGIEQSAAENALNTLLAATLANLREKGIPDALTGPLTRADIGTLQAHLNALGDEELQDMYRLLARLSIPMLESRGIPTAEVEEILQDET